MITCFCLSTSFWLLLLARTEASKSDDPDKSFKICSVSGGLDIARLTSSNTRNLFRNALEDVELIREYISEAANNGGIAGGLHSLDELDKTLDWEARNFSAANASTLSAGLGYSDDRKDRRVERYVGKINEPYVGTKTSDLALIDSASNIFPWIVDRRSDEEKWHLSHQNGRSNRMNTKFDRLYVAAWIGTRGEAWLYYPPLSKTVGHPFGFGDVLGPNYDSQEEEFVKPNLPKNNPERKAYFTPPYADTAVPGLSLITAQAPVYFTGVFQGHTYDNTYIASTGVDISLASMSTLLDELQDTLAEGSFAFLVGAKDFHIVVISQSTVEKIYPQRTGFEEGRVTYDTADGSVLNDRRNQTYQVSDTIFQSPKGLNNANWTGLAFRVKTLSPGERSSTVMNITLTGETEPTLFYVMYERWIDVADWALVVFAPQREVDNAISVRVDQQVIELEVLAGAAVEVESIIVNNGTMDVTVGVEKLPPWFTLLTEIDDRIKLLAGRNQTLRYTADTEDLPGKATSLIAFTIADDGYTDCFFEQVLTVDVLMKLIYEEELNQLNRIRPYGFILAGITAVSTIGCSFWVFTNSKHRVVRASQPIFLQMICAGILLMGLSIIPMGIDDSLVGVHGCNVACMSVPWLLALGFSVTYSALFSKIWRINQIVRACKNYRRVHVSVRHVMVPFFVICTLNVTLLSLWTGLDPLVWIREPKGDSTLKDFSSIGYCGQEGSNASRTFSILLFFVNFVALVLALIQLYRARALSDEYSEGKYIAIAVGSMVQVFLTGVPILVIVTDNPQASFLVKSSIVFVISMSSLLLMFVPKFIMAQEKQERRSPESGGFLSSGEFVRKGSKLTSSRKNSPEMGIEHTPCSTQSKIDPALAAHSFAEIRGKYSTPLSEDGISAEQSGSLPSRKRSEPSKGHQREALPSISDISMSFGASEYESPFDYKTAFRDDLASCENAKLPRRTPTIFEESSVDNSAKNKSKCCDESTRPKIDFNSVVPTPPRTKSEYTNAALPNRAPSVSEEIPPQSQPRSTSLYSNASLPMRAPSLVEEITDSPPRSKIEYTNSALPTRAPSVAEDMCPQSQPRSTSLYSNASLPKRAPSLVEESPQSPGGYGKGQGTAALAEWPPSPTEAISQSRQVLEVNSAMSQCQ